jgi:signal transduction histidine kinase
MIFRIIHRALRVSLVHKLIGANIIIVVSAILVRTLSFNGRSSTEALIAVASLAAATVVNIMLVRIALRPIDEIERIAERVSGGDFAVRSTPSLLADNELRRVGQTVNALLDALAAERKRIQDLGAQVVRAQDLEKATVSRELHDSIAQTLAAVRFQLAAAAKGGNPAEIRNIIVVANSLISSAMDEIMSVSYALHSRVAVDLGLEAALSALARQTAERYSVDVDVDFDSSVSSIPADVSATLYRVAEVALSGFDVQQSGKSAKINVSSCDGSVRLEVTRDAPMSNACAADNGDLSRAGLAMVRNRVLLAGGTMETNNAPNGEMRVLAELRMLKVAS